MNNSEPGRPGGFKRGHDPRRNMGGNKNVEAQNFAVEFRNALAKEMKPSAVAKLLIEEVKKKKPWAIQEFLDRLMGKPAQPIEHGGEIYTPIFRMPRPNATPKSEEKFKHELDKRS